MLALVGSAVALIMSVGHANAASISTSSNIPVLILLLATLGMMLMISANSLIGLYLGLELQSLALYVVCRDQPRQSAFNRSRPEVLRPRRAVVGHAAVRHVSLVYGYTGNTGFQEIAVVHSAAASA